MTQVTLSLPHPIVFLFDVPNTHVQVPEYVSGVPTSANGSCVSVNTRSKADGDVTIRLGRHIPADQKVGCQVVYQGEVRTPGMGLAVVTSEYNTILDIGVRGDRATVTISVDDPDGAGLIVIEVQ
jgi:hypothetical protein